MVITSGRSADTTAIIKRMVNRLACTALTPLTSLSKYYSSVLEQEINIRQTLLLLNAQTAFVFTAFPVDGPLVLRALCAAWLLHAVLKCKQAI